MSEGCGAVLVDRAIEGPQYEVAGAVITAGSDAAIAGVDDPRFVVLRHPAESFDLAKTGYSWKDLLKQGRFVSVSNVVCRECGTVFPRRRLAVPGASGCMSGLVIGAVAGLLTGVWRRSTFEGVVASCLVAAAVAWVSPLSI
jgi:hypothetical protein